MGDWQNFDNRAVIGRALRLRREIDEFEATAQKSNGWVRIDLRQRIDDLKVKRALVRAKLDEFVAAGSDRRKGLMVGLERVWNDLKATFDELKL